MLSDMDVSIGVRPLGKDDLDAAAAILDAAYAAPRGYRGELARYLRLQPDGWLLALLDGRPAGVVGAIDYGPFAYVGLMGVHPRGQRRGVALALMGRLLDWLDARHCPLALLDASAAGEPLYARLGFVEDARSLLFRRETGLPTSAASAAPAATVTPLRPDDLPALARFDRPIFGADHSAVFASYLADAPERAFLARDRAGAIEGYVFAQTQRLGPWAASRPEDADALLTAALSLPFDDAPVTLVPSVNPDAARLLRRHGFALQRSLSHMRRGGDAPPGRRALLYGQASFAIG